MYRHRPVYAVGHGCAADWNVTDRKVKSVWTEVLPTFLQAPVLARSDVKGANLSMLKFSQDSTPQVAATCRALLAAYRKWIADREADLVSDLTITGELKKAGREHLDNCTKCADRMETGIKILEADEDAFRAFRLMNKAMVEQREHYELSSDAEKRRTWKKGANGPEPAAAYAVPQYPTKTAWRPFQLAFILMNLRAFTEPASDDRRVVDTIWFPTGGGKTEAYLGLAAFAILHRRLVDPADAGTTVLMRYTLRLLTTQQFQRAASLICALELIRRTDEAAFGEVPITLGLWLGSGVTPNREDQAVKDYQALGRGEGGNRFVVLSCPWCGVDMGPREYGREIRAFGYHLERDAGGRRQFVFRCEDTSCEFSKVRRTPAGGDRRSDICIPANATHRNCRQVRDAPMDTRFPHDLRHRQSACNTPPDLIIQDELHLISGPLGSMVGHYETVIDELTTRVEGERRIPAKIVASTATIARAAEQVEQSLRSQLCPCSPRKACRPEIRFSRRKAALQMAGRTSACLATALPSHVTAQVRTLATLLQAPSTLRRPGSAAVDPYWTLMVYFNSLRELGRASTLVQADIREYLNSVWDRIGPRRR